MNWWHKEVEIFGKTRTPTSFLESHYQLKSDRIIANILCDALGKPVTRNAVKKKRQALGLVKSASPQEAKCDYEETENGATIETVENKPLTKSDLVRVYHIDTNIWEFDRFKINSWQVAAKDNDGNLITERLYKTEASLVRKVPLAVFPEIKPMRVENKPATFPQMCVMNSQTSLVFADPHFGYLRDLRNAKLTPFHNRAALNLITNVAAAIQPGRIDILGDWLDLPDWSDKFVRSPEFYFTTQPAIIESHWYLHQLRLCCPSAQINLHAGNHDKRMELAIQKYLPVAYDLKPATKVDLPPALSIPSLLDLESLNINYISDYPNDVDKLGNRLEIMHGDTARAEFNTVSDIAKRCNTSRIVGHIHRRESATHTHWNGHKYYTVEGICPGCVCHIDGRVPGRTKRQQWQSGLMLVSYYEDNYSYTQLPIENDQLLFNGNTYIGIDYTKQLRENYPEWNW